MEIKFLKAGTGDSIIIHHKGHNIIIDGGNDSVYLLSEVDKIYEEKQVINLLVVTHHDDDHIKGIIDLLNHIKDSGYDKENKFIDQVIFNSPRKILNKLKEDTSNQLSYKQAHKVEKILSTFNVDWKKSTEIKNVLNFNGLKIEVFSPTEEDLQKYGNQKGAYLTGDFKCDWEVSMKTLEKYIDDSSLDNTLPNKSSIVLNIKVDDKSILLTGDITPNRLNNILSELVKKNDDNPLEFDIIKLPHHGSYRSITKNIIKNVKCNTFVISTNSKKHYLPNKRALLKIIKYIDRDNNTPINFVFNYEETINKLQITNKEKRDYNFKLIPNNKTYGFSF